MEFTWKFAEDCDIEACCEVEEAAIPGYSYLSDAWNYYKNNDGKLVCALCDGKIVGIGRISVMPDKIGWLECLRVKPEFQGNGAGKLIYDVYKKVAEEYGCRGMAMFTGKTNVVSSNLAEKYGLKTRSAHQTYVINDFSGGENRGFHQVNPQRAVEIILPKKEEYDDYMTLNRTFYHITEENIKAFADNGFVFENAEGDFVVCGARFQHSKALHVLMMGGNTANCTAFVKSMALSLGVKQISFLITEKNYTFGEELEKNGFEKNGNELITKEVLF